MEGCASVRTVLWFLVFTGFAINYMFRININIGIVSMVKSRETKQSNLSHSSECIETSANRNLTILNSALLDEPKFDWDEKQQSLILGGFFWLHWVCQVPGGILAQRYGTKLVFGLSNFMPCLLSFLIPFCASFDYRALVFLRVLQGFVGGLSWPSMHNLTASWIPPNERSKFVTAYMGSSIGAGITYPLCGFLINWFGWQSQFYVTGTFGIIWFTAWWLLVYDTPHQHPRISTAEKSHILSSLGKTVSREKPQTPWKKIILSLAMWMNILVQWGSIWSLFTLMTQAPTYFRFIHGWDIRMTGLFSGLPHLCRITFALLMSAVGDYFLQKNIMSRTNVRKMATGTCCFGQGLFVLGLAFSGCNSIAAIICLTAATGLSGAVSTGPLASLIDISPNFASVMLGISNMITVIPGFISPIIVGELTYENQTVGQWTLVFLITAVMLLIPGILYQFLSSSEIQDWNTPAGHELENMCSKETDKIINHNNQNKINETKHKTNITND